METLTIELKNPNAKKLIEDLAELDLISILKPSSWAEKWQKLSYTLPNVTELSENDVLGQIQAHRHGKKSTEK